MAQHTQGEWKINSIEEGKLYIEADQGTNNPTICNLYEDVTPFDSVTIGAWLKAFDNSEANARLIAAAPKLLEALTHAHALMTQLDIFNDRNGKGFKAAEQMYASAIDAAKGIKHE